MKTIIASILTALFCWVSVTALAPSAFAICTDDVSNVANCLKSSKPNGVIEAGDFTIKEGLRNKAISTANKLIGIIALLAIGGVVMGGFFMVTAYGEDEKIKKGKTSLKFAIIGLVVALVSFGVVNAIINFFYSAGS